MDCSKIKVVKKDGTREDFNVQKVLSAISKSAERAMITFSRAERNFICEFVEEKAEEMDQELIPIAQMHNIVEGALEKVNPLVAKSYRDYRNYKQDFVRMLDDVYKKSQSIMYIGDKENSNTDSALVSTKRSLIFNELNKSLYQKFFMTVEELQACREGYIYIHDMSARRDTMNCCLFDVKSVLTGGFEMGNLWYNEPKTLDVAFDVIGDIVLSADLVENASYRLTAPGLGGEMGATLGDTAREFYQGLFLAPHIVVQAVKTAVFAAAVFKGLGYAVKPLPEERRSDIIQAITLESKQRLCDFCVAIQGNSPVDAHVEPVPSPLPGYQDEIIMAAGTFVQGASIELSADGPCREPFNVFFQGGLTFEHGRLAIMAAAKRVGPKEA